MENITQALKRFLAGVKPWVKRHKRIVVLSLLSIVLPLFIPILLLELVDLGWRKIKGPLKNFLQRVAALVSEKLNRS